MYHLGVDWPEGSPAAPAGGIVDENSGGKKGREPGGKEEYEDGGAEN